MVLAKFASVRGSFKDYQKYMPKFSVEDVKVGIWIYPVCSLRWCKWEVVVQCPC